MIVEPLEWKLRTLARDNCLLHGINSMECEFPLQAHHVLSQATLRKNGREEFRWDLRNGMGLCYKAHRRHDLAVERVPYRLLSEANIRFAIEMDLDHLLDRYYPKENGVTEFDSEKPRYDWTAHPTTTITSTSGSGTIATYNPDTHAHTVVDGPASTAKCPTCERTLPKPHTKSEEPKQRKGWTIAVPVSELENGAEVLDTLLEECRKLFGHDESNKVRYFTVTQALALVLQDSTRLEAA